MATIHAYDLGKSCNDFFSILKFNLRKILKYFNFLCFCCYLGHYRQYVAYPHLYQTYPASFERPIMGQPIESHQRNICKNNNGEVVPCHKSFVENVDQSRIKPGMSNIQEYEWENSTDCKTACLKFATFGPVQVSK